MERKQVDKINIVNRKMSVGIILWIAFLTIMMIHGNLMVLTVSLDSHMTPGLLPLLLVAEFSACCIALGYRFRSWKRMMGLLGFFPWIVGLMITSPFTWIRGGAYWINLLIDQWNIMHDSAFMLIPINASESDVISFCYAMAVVVGELSWWIISSRRFKFCFLIVFMAYVVQIFVGQFDPVGAGVLIGVMFGVYVSGSRMHLTIRGAIWALGAAVLVCLLGIGNHNLQSITDARESLQTAIHDVRYGERLLPEGNLYDASLLHEGEEAVLTLTSQQEKDIYLRGFVGGYIIDGIWKPLSDAHYSGKNSGILDWLEKEDFVPVSQIPTYYELDKDSYTPVENQITITVSGAARDYIYEPYGIKTYEHNKMKTRRDSLLQPRGLFGQREYTFSEITSSKPAELLVPDAWLSDPTTKAQKTYTEAENVYRQFVYENYMDVDADTKDLIEDLFWKDYQSDADGIYSAISHIRDVMSEHLTYQKDPADVPEGLDPVVWFLQDSKQGNDMLYATVAVEALRVHGIPARYVEGYYVSGNALAASDGGRLTLKASDAHAWPEVYFDGVGWQPVDVTPGYYYETMSLQQMISAPDTIHKTAALDDGSGQEEQTLDSGSFDAAMMEASFTKAVASTKTALGIVGIVLILLVFVYCLFEIFRLICVAHIQYNYIKAGKKKRVRLMGTFIFYYLNLWGIDTDLGWNTGEVDALVTEKFSNVEAGEYTRICGLLEKLFYGDCLLEPYESHTLQEFLEKLSFGKGLHDRKMWLKLRYAPITYVCKN